MALQVGAALLGIFTFFLVFGALSLRARQQKAGKRPHDTNSVNCWCGPDLEQPCPEWDAKPGTKCLPTCWACRGRTMVPAYDLDDENLPTLIVHQEDTDHGQV